MNYMRVRKHEPIPANFGDTKDQVRWNRQWFVRDKFSLYIQGIHGVSRAHSVFGKRGHRRSNFLPFESHWASLLAKADYCRRMESFASKKIEREANDFLPPSISAPDGVKD
jgi:hypothetical protein